MRTHLVDHPAIVIEPLNQPIPAENGSETARAIGQRPEHNASVVIWGDCTLTPDPELYVHFDILKDTTTYLQTGAYEQYGPAQIQQPTIFEFKLTLSEHLAQLTAFTAALALYEDDQHLAAAPLFNTAAGAIDHPLGQDMERAIRFHRGTSYLYLGQAIDAKQDLELLIPDPENSIQRFDDIAIASLGNLGLAYAQLGQVEEAIAYHEHALAIAQQIGDKGNEGNWLGNLGIVYKEQNRSEDARRAWQQALVIYEQINSLDAPTVRQWLAELEDNTP
jgi:tetratricopeptide (TPR) repeat protein